MKDILIIKQYLLQCDWAVCLWSRLPKEISRWIIPPVINSVFSNYSLRNQKWHTPNLWLVTCRSKMHQIGQPRTVLSSSDSKLFQTVLGCPIWCIWVCRFWLHKLYIIYLLRRELICSQHFSLGQWSVTIDIHSHESWLYLLHWPHVSLPELRGSRRLDLQRKQNNSIL